jgi:hypothetical protein
MRFVWSLLAALASSAVASCNLDAAVFVDPEIEAPAVTVTKSALGTGLKGSFTLTLHLSARASGPSQVTLGTFTLKKNNETSVVLDNLPFSADMSSPIAVAEDSTTTVTATIDSGSKLLDATVADAICAGDIVIAGVIQDSLQTSTTPVVSEPFTPTCP